MFIPARATETLMASLAPGTVKSHIMSTSVRGIVAVALPVNLFSFAQKDRIYICKRIQYY